jgi:uncharacterized protein with HEPN domain
MSRDAATVDDILAAASRIDRFVTGLNRETFINDEKTRVDVPALATTLRSRPPA